MTGQQREERQPEWFLNAAFTWWLPGGSRIDLTLVGEGEWNARTARALAEAWEKCDALAHALRPILAPPSMPEAARREEPGGWE